MTNINKLIDNLFYLKDSIYLVVSMNLFLKLGDKRTPIIQAFGKLDIVRFKDYIYKLSGSVYFKPMSYGEA